MLCSNTYATKHHDTQDATEWTELQIFEAAEHVLADAIKRNTLPSTIGDLAASDWDIDRLEAMPEKDLMHTLQVKVSVFWEARCIDYLNEEERG